MTALIQYELSSNCTCETTDENDNTITDFCFGCYTDDFANLKYSIIEPWLTANGLSKPDQVLISVERATWRNVSGYGLALATTGFIIDALTFNGDWRLVFTYDGDKTMTAVRYSHDEPTGTGTFTFRKATDEETGN